MVGMPTPPERTGPDRIPSETVIEFGPGPEPPRRRWNTAGVLTGLTDDRRAVPLTAVLAAVALFASLVSEWQLTDLLRPADFSSLTELAPLRAGVADLGSLGSGYVVGLFALTATVVLTMFGPEPGRRYARLLGLSTGGVLLALIAAITADLGEGTRSGGRFFTAGWTDDQIEIAYGRGPWCALIGVAAAMLALHLAGRHATTAGEEPGAEPGWSWRRPAAGDDAENPPDGPMDLTVGPAQPFTTLSDDRNRSA